VNTIKNFDVTFISMKNNYQDIKSKIVIKMCSKSSYKNILIFINCYNYTIQTLSIFHHDCSLWIVSCRSWKFKKLVNEDKDMKGKRQKNVYTKNSYKN